MSEPKKLRFLVDDFEDVQTKGLLPDIDLGIQNSIEIGVDKLQENLNNTLKDLFEMLSNLELESKNFEIDSITFTLNINATGEFSIVSLAKGSVGGQAGLEFNIVRRR